MDLVPSAEQDEIVAAAAGLLAEEVPAARLRELRDAPSSRDAALWARCAQQGWFGLGLPAELGGVGYGLVEEALLFRELGRRLVPGPFLATTLAARLAALGGRADLAAALLAGEATAGLALARPDLSSRDTVTGEVDLLDAVDADVVLAVSAGSAALVAAADLAGRVQVACLDPLVRLEQVSLTGVPVLAVRDGGEIWLRGLVLAAAMLAGIAEATRDMAVAHAVDRVQFGRPIGVHQAIKHRCADMAVRAEAAASQMAFAALAHDEGRADALAQATAANLVAARAAVANAASNIQVHGGLGYTFEHAAHLYLRRAHVVERAMGEQRAHLARMLELAPAI